MKLLIVMFLLISHDSAIRRLIEYDEKACDGVD